mmetsp:Transcript_26469/g.69625  ORF Transcript_26469/g.69625 Transcript_26469/m.69625 type:complete len:299 (-) Transcript_26469:2113-3009(-)
MKRIGLAPFGPGLPELLTTSWASGPSTLTLSAWLTFLVRTERCATKEYTRFRSPPPTLSTTSLPSSDPCRTTTPSDCPVTVTDAICSCVPKRPALTFHLSVLYSALSVITTMRSAGFRFFEILTAEHAKRILPWWVSKAAMAVPSGSVATAWFTAPIALPPIENPALVPENRVWPANCSRISDCLSGGSGPTILRAHHWPYTRCLRNAAAVDNVALCRGHTTLLGAKPYVGLRPSSLRTGWKLLTMPSKKPPIVFDTRYRRHERCSRVATSSSLSSRSSSIRNTVWGCLINTFVFPSS